MVGGRERGSVDVEAPSEALTKLSSKTTSLLMVVTLVSGSKSRNPLDSWLYPIKMSFLDLESNLRRVSAGMCMKAAQPNTRKCATEGLRPW